MGNIKKFDWERWNKNRFDSRMPTEKEANTLVKMFQECPWCTIRDILIDAGITDEMFPNFYYDIINNNLQVTKNSHDTGRKTNC